MKSRSSPFQNFTVEKNADNTVNLLMADGRKFLGCYPLAYDCGRVEVTDKGVATVTVKIQYQSVDGEHAPSRTRNTRSPRGRK